MDSSRRREVERIRQILVRGIAAAKAQEGSEARYNLQMVIDQDSESNQQVEAYYHLSLIEADEKKRRALIENILAIQPSEPRARRALAVMDGQLINNETFDPNALKSSEYETSHSSFPLRFECPNCSGPLRFDPAQSNVACPYCGITTEASSSAAIPEEQSFTAGLATARGHSRPHATQVFTCTACSVEYMLAPSQLSFQCPHCDSSYSLIQPETKELIPPGAIYPPILSAEDAERQVREWWDKNRLTNVGGLERLSPLFLPVWTFDFGGTASWSAEVYKNQEWGPLRGIRLIDIDDLLVPASKQARNLINTRTTELARAPLAIFSPEKTAGWVAETYSITMSDAAITARGLVVKETRRNLEKEILGEFRHLQLGTSEIVIEGYKLALVPVWYSHYSLWGKRYEVAVNAVTGQIVGELPPTRLDRFIQWLLGH